MILVVGALAQPRSVEVVGSPIALTSPGIVYMSPCWSPDGSTIAVTGPGYHGIHLVSFPDGEVLQLSDDPAAGFGMAWSHDGLRIAARIARFENNRRYNAVAVFDAITGEAEIVSDYETLMPGVPRWTADDSHIYLSGTDRFRLYAATSALPGIDQAPAQQSIVYVREDRVYRHSLADSRDVELDMLDGRILNLVPSPDGRKIAFEVIGGNVWVMDSDGSNAVDLGTGDSPCWNPTGNMLTYAITTDDGHRILSADIFVVNADGTGRVNLTDTDDTLEMHPSWSPDGKWIAYETLLQGRIMVQEVR